MRCFNPSPLHLKKKLDKILPSPSHAHCDHSKAYTCTNVKMCYIGSLFMMLPAFIMPKIVSMNFRTVFSILALLSIYVHTYMDHYLQYNVEIRLWNASNHIQMYMYNKVLLIDVSDIEYFESRKYSLSYNTRSYRSSRCVYNKSTIFLRYYDQLCAMESKLPISEDQVFNVFM